jgi:hypothetical protein
MTHKLKKGAGKRNKKTPQLLRIEDRPAMVLLEPLAGKSGNIQTKYFGDETISI